MPFIINIYETYSDAKLRDWTLGVNSDPPTKKNDMHPEQCYTVSKKMITNNDIVEVRRLPIIWSAHSDCEVTGWTSTDDGQIVSRFDTYLYNGYDLSIEGYLPQIKEGNSATFAWDETFYNKRGLTYTATLSIIHSENDAFKNKTYTFRILNDGNTVFSKSFHVAESGGTTFTFPVKYGELRFMITVSGSAFDVKLDWETDADVDDFFDPEMGYYYVIEGVTDGGDIDDDRSMLLNFSHIPRDHFPRAKVIPFSENRVEIYGDHLYIGPHPGKRVPRIWGKVDFLPDIVSYQFYDDKGNPVDSKYAEINDSGHIIIHVDKMIEDGYYPYAIYLWCEHKESYLDAEPATGYYEYKEDNLTITSQRTKVHLKKYYTGNKVSYVPLIVYFRPCEVPMGDINKWGWKPYIYYFDTYNIKPYCEQFIVKPNCICYTNRDPDEKTVTFNAEAKLNIKSEYLGWFDADVQLWYGGIKLKSFGNRDQFSYTFRMPPNTVEFYTMKLIVGNVEVAKEQIVVERQKYCHSIEIEARTYDKEGNETNKFPHPTSSDWKEDKYGEIIVKFKVKDEQGNYIDVPVDKIKTNWQYSVEKVDTGVYQMKIPNHKDSTALAIGGYGIAVYIDKQWCDENGYYNKYNIEAENIIINSDKIEKIGLWNFEGITGYENGTTLLNQVYEKVSGTFVNPVCQFSIVEQLNEEKERRQYSYCYRIYDSPMNLNLPTYTDEEKKELAKAIVREMGKPRKIETFTILSKEIPKINQSITVNFNGELISFPVYSCHFHLSNKTIQIQVKNNPVRLLKDYLKLLK